eukprot:Nk52_evm15s485 gene=Nk52_evmTU15s485
MEKMECYNPTSHEKTTEEGGESSVTVYKRRFLMLGIYSLLNGAVGLTWVTFSPIVTQTEAVYGVSADFINWFGNVILLMFIPGIFFANVFVIRFGTRVTFNVSAALMTAGCWVRYIGADTSIVSRDHFYIAFIGQCLNSIGVLMVYSMTPRVSADWFPVNERAMATAFVTIVNTVINAIGFLIPSFMVTPYNTDGNYTPEQLDVLKGDIPRMLMVEAIIVTAIGLSVVVFYRSEPPSPPSLSQAMKPRAQQLLYSTSMEGGVGSEKKEEGQEECFKTMMTETLALLKNGNFVLLLVSCGLITGISLSWALLLGTILDTLESSDTIGYVGFVNQFSIGIGMFSLSAICARLKDRHYKHILILAGSCMSIATLFWLIVINNIYSTAAMWPISILMGFFSYGTLPLYFEFGADMTYPINENMSAGLLNLFSFATAFIFNVIFQYFSVLAINTGMLVCVFIGMALMLFTREKGASFVPRRHVNDVVIMQ